MLRKRGSRPGKLLVGPDLIRIKSIDWMQALKEVWVEATNKPASHELK